MAELDQNSDSLVTRTRLRWLDQSERYEVRQLPFLALLCAAIGLLAGLVVELFRFLIKQLSLLAVGVPYEQFEDLSIWWLLLVPIVSAIGVGCIGKLLRTDGRQTGVVHVMDRVHGQRTKLPGRNGLFQFIGGTLALGGGSPGGWIGPTVHLGAVSSRQIFRYLNLTDRAKLTMISAGVAAAVGACLYAPIAGVIFALEVVLIRWTVNTFIPLMIAAVTATAARQFFGSEALLSVPDLALTNFLELLVLVPIGIGLGIVAAAFNHATTYFASIQVESFFVRMCVVGGATGLIAMFLPSVLGTGFDTWDHALVNSLGWSAITILGFAIAKLALTSLAAGFGMPVGIIGPNLVVGAVLGLLAHGAFEALFPGTVTSSVAVYAMLGAAAMMAAVLNAPLTALVLTLEMCGDLALVLPAMVIIAFANLTTAPLFGRKSIFEARLRAMGIDIRKEQVV